MHWIQPRTSSEQDRTPAICELRQCIVHNFGDGGQLSWNIIGLLPFPILTCPSSFITFLLLPSFSVLPISQDWLAQKQSFFDIYAALFHAYISYLIMWCDCHMSQSLISHHVTGYALLNLFFYHCITFWLCSGGMPPVPDSHPLIEF